MWLVPVLYNTFTCISHMIRDETYSSYLIDLQMTNVSQ